MISKVSGDEFEGYGEIGVIAVKEVTLLIIKEKYKTKRLLFLISSLLIIACVILLIFAPRDIPVISLLTPVLLVISSGVAGYNGIKLETPEGLTLETTNHNTTKNKTENEKKAPPKGDTATIAH